MDIHDRNRLPDSDFADFMLNFGEWWEKYGNTTLTLVLIIILGGVAYWFFTSRAYQAHENAWADLAFNTSPQGFREVAQTHDDPAVKSLAYLRAGDLLLGEAVTPQETTSQAATQETTAGDKQAVTPAQPPRDPKTALKDAEHNYQQVLAVAKNPIYRLNALMGLGAVAESREQWDAAKEQYQKAVQLAGDTYQVIADQAKRRIALLPELKTPVIFAPAPPPKAAKSSTKPNLSESASHAAPEKRAASDEGAGTSSSVTASPTPQTTASPAVAP